MNLVRHQIAVGIVLLILAGCRAQRAEVVVLGTMHQMHAEMPYFSFAKLRELIIALKPDVFCVELQPGDLSKRPPELNKREYPEVIYPLLDQRSGPVYPMEPPAPEFSEIVASVAAANRSFLQRQPDAAERLQTYVESAYTLLAGYWRSPGMVNDAFTDAIFAAKHAAQGRLIGPAETDGWEAWNEHLLSVILRAAVKHPGKRIVVIVGAEHAYWLRARLRSDRNILLADTPALLESL